MRETEVASWNETDIEERRDREQRGLETPVVCPVNAVGYV